MNKYFIITVDTESDNQWDICSEQFTENAKYIPRFQELCEKYNFKPVYLLDYPMANDKFLVSYLSGKKDKCEIGAHPHSWSTPPLTSSDILSTRRPYLYECSEDVIKEKVKNLTRAITINYGVKPISHRAGRWAMDERYFKVISEWGYKVDCSVTPGINWEKQLGYKRKGSNYKNESCKIYKRKDENDILEVPVTIERIKIKKYEKNFNLKDKFKCFVYRYMGKNIWLRPSISDLDEMKLLINYELEKGSKYLEFMIHSSELMPGGSPYYSNKEQIEALYKTLDQLFDYIASMGYEGITLEEVYNLNK